MPIMLFIRELSIPSSATFPFLFPLPMFLKLHVLENRVNANDPHIANPSSPITSRKSWPEHRFISLPPHLNDRVAQITRYLLLLVALFHQLEMALGVGVYWIR